MDLRIALFLLGVCAVLVEGSGNSLKDPYVCGPPSCTPSGKFKYLPEIIYHYDYRVSVNTWFAGSGTNSSTLTVSTAVTLQFITPCEGLLQLKSVSLKDQDESYPLERQENFVNGLSKNALRFAFHDGVITEICPSADEEDWVLNFKRAVLSLYQNTMRRFDIDHRGSERDIHGTCDTKYQVRGQENTSLIVLKIRDLTQCIDRYKYMSILQTVRYNFQSKYQTWPVLKSESKCRISIDHNVYSSVTCRERHLFEPFSGKLSGAATSVEQRLQLVREINKTDSELVDESPAGWTAIAARSNLLHHHTPILRQATGELKNARDILKLLCKIEQSHDENGPRQMSDNLDSGSVVGVWGNLVRACRALHYPALAQLLARSGSICVRAKKHLVDALPYIASAGSVELIKDMILRSTAGADTRREWLMSMGMIPRPKKEMIGSMLELLQKFPTDKVVSFTSSSMVHSYCRSAAKPLRECCEEDINAQIVKIFQDNVIEIIGHGSANLSRSDREKLTVSIKALGNIGGFKKNFIDILMGVIDNTDFPTYIRLVAIDAFRRTPCVETREYFLHLFREDYMDVEVRLASYLQVMRCPSLVTVRKIFHALQNEPVNQVATFVWSHLNNLGQSSIPSRVEIQGLLSGNTVPPLQDSPDFRRYSRNYEQGVFFDQFNAGGNYESNVIFSPSSYIPRSVSLNLTVDMFGESVNILELKARAEGFETYFEQIFGNNGPLSRDKVNEQIQNIRVFRSLNDADDVRAKIDSLGYEPEALKHQFPLADLGVKVFGNEISYWNAEGDEDIRNSLKQLNPMYQIKKILSGQEISYKKASLFLDTTYSVPTGCGLPLQMKLMGTSYVDLRMSGAMAPPPRNLTAPYTLQTEGKIHPSVALNVAATMGVAAGTHSSTGIRVNMRLYTATAVEASLKIRGTKLVHLDLSLPYTKQEIFGAKSELIILHGDKEIQQRGINEKQIEQNTCSWSAVDTAIGIKICAAYQFPNMTNLRDAPYFLMSGPSKYLVSLEKVDPSAKNYTFHYEWDQNDTANLITLSFDTPNSRSKRTFNASLSYQADSGKAAMAFQSNEHTLKAHATYKNHPDDKLIESVLDIDGQKHFDAVLSLKKHPLKNGYVYIPNMYVIVNNERITELSGTLRLAQKKGVSQCDVSLEFQTKRLASRLIGYITWNGPSRGAKLRLDYQFLNENKQSIKMEGVVSNRAMGARYDLYGELGLEFTSYPHLNFFSGVKYLSTVNHIETKLNISSSRLTRYSDPKLQFGFVMHQRISGVTVDTALVLHRPEVHVHLKFEEAGAQYTTLAVLSYDPSARDVVVSGKLYWPPGQQLYIDAALNMTLPSLHPLRLKTRVHEKSANEFAINVGCIWFNGADFDVNALYQDQSTTNMAAHHVKLLMSSQHYSDMSADARFTQDDKQTTLAAQGEYNEQNYGTYVRYILHSENCFNAYAQLDISGKVHSLGVIADLNNNTSVDVDLHIEQVRDVHLSYYRKMTEQLKQFTAVLNWDANRDPSQKLSLNLELKNLAAWDYAGNLLLYYPGRMINGQFEFLFRDWFCRWLVRLGWSPEDAVLWDVKLYSEAKDETIYALLSKLDTPFQGWEDSSLNLMWRYHDNLQALNGSMTWQKDHLSFGLLADYLFKTNEFYGEVNAIVNSSIPTLPKAAAIAKHRHVWKKSADTLLSFQYNNDKVLMINSSWLLDRGQNENNITGRVTLKTPVPGYYSGLLRTQFVFGHVKRDVKGVTYLDLDEKNFKITVDGHMRRLTNSMLVVNVTSPIALYSHICGRFGFVEADRHLVAMVTAPKSTTGVEILMRLSTMQVFHVFAHVALPIQFLNRALLQAKRDEEEVDFRLGWDKMDFGFTGIWHYQSISNFQYLYKLFTPLEGFEENGCVLKNIYGNGLDTEFSVRLSKHKLGVAVLMRDTGSGLIDVISDKLHHKTSRNSLLADFETDTYVTLDTLYYPTITFHSNMNKHEGSDQEEIFKMAATLNLPNKTAIILTNQFVLYDYSTMTNSLQLLTPFAVLKELKSVYTVEITIGEKYNVTFQALLHNGTHWHETSVRVLYDYTTGEENEYSAYQASLLVVTPLAVLPSLDSLVTVHIEDTLTRMSAAVGMPSFSITARGQFEMDEPFVESSGSLNLTSPFLEDYYISMEFKKDFTSEENTVAWGIQVQQGTQNNYMFAETIWNPSTATHIRVKARAALVPVLPPTDLSGHYAHDRDEMRRSLHVECRLGDEFNFYSLTAEQRSREGALAIKSPMKGFRNVNILGKIENDDVVRGSLVSDTVEYNIDGKLKSQNPLDVTLNLIPKGKGEKFILRLKCELSDTKYVVSASLIGVVQMSLNAKLELTKTFTDVYFKLDAPQMREKEVFLKARLDLFPGNRSTFNIQANTPLKHLRHLKGDTDMMIGPKTGYVKCLYDMTDMKGDGDLKWSFLWDDLYLKALGHQMLKDRQRSVDFNAYFGNSTDKHNMFSTNGGFWMDLDKVWQIGANASYGFITDVRILLLLNAFLPKPNVDVHSLTVDIGSVAYPLSSLDAKYTTDVTHVITGVMANYKLLTDGIRANASAAWGAGGKVSRVQNMLRTFMKDNNSLAIDYALYSPLYAGQETFQVNGSYSKDVANDFIIVEGVMHRPGTSQVGEVDITYGGVRHTSGHFNLTTPFQNLPWLKAILNVTNGEYESYNHVDAFWPNKSASLNAHHRCVREESGVGQSGDISLTIPLSTKRRVDTKYLFMQGDTWSRGNATLNFDSVQFVQGKFKQVLSKSARRMDLATTDIEVENQHTPVGIKYIHEYEETGNVDVKQATVFHLRNASSFNVTGIVDVSSWDAGKTIKLTAIHSERTLTFENNYEVRDRELIQGSKIKWAEDVWINYDIKVVNTTTADTESQQVIMNVLYPRRTFNLVADYRLQDSLLDGSAELNWDLERGKKTSELKARWENPPLSDGNLHLLHVSLHHPSFKRDVTLEGAYASSATIMSNISIDLRYSDYENEHLKLKSVLRDNSDGPTRDYQFDLTCTHPTSNLDLEMRSDLNIKNRWYFYNNYYRFKKTMFGEKLRETKGLIDLNNNMLTYERNNETDQYRLNSTWDLSYPQYKVLGFVNRTTGTDDAIVLLSMYDRSLVAHYNSSDDISYHLIGVINDARSAQLNSWRDFDDVTTVDISSYIRLNHSRLLTSSILWRPEIFGEIRSQALFTLKQVYMQLNESLTIVKDAPMESHSALKNVWSDAKLKIRDFLDDLNDLHVIKEDLDEFHTFLNVSYYKNDFYVKDIIEFSYYVLDQMALKNHFESLPAMVNEMWGMMGDTSASIKKSLMWVIETIKNSYSSFVETFNKILEADFMDQVSDILENGIMKYDNFIRDLHLRFVAYWETTWTNAVGRFVKSWKSLLKSMEPTFLKFVHYAETFVWTIGKEVMDFFYERTHELTESPYFNYVSTLGQDLDHFLKDITHNDAITNIKKYSAIAYNAIYNRFIVHLPFRKEVQEISSEILHELNQLQELSIVKFLKAKFWEAKGRLQWWYDYFHLGEAAAEVWEVLYAKLTEKVMTALNYEEQHRTPKTNFIFDPHKGEILLEQKLPMSWHAFNRTPDFSEIPEYKAVRDVIDNWIMSNRSIWSYYYDIKPYMDINNVVPPFAGMAIMTGQGTLVTFDKQVFTVAETGTFLLSHDYKQGNFSIMMESNEQGRYNLVVLTGKQLVHVDLYREQVSIGESVALTLPAGVGECILDREVDAVTISSRRGVDIQCNFLFNTCKVQLSGWYYATVGGLFGTMTNEQYDDLQLPNGSYTKDTAVLSRGWNLEPRRGGAAVDSRDTKNDTQCDMFFRNKVSPLHPCFSMIDSTPFYAECMSGVESCALASSYLEMCSQENVPIHIPDQCVQCTSPQGRIIEEGTFFNLEYIPNSTDVVFLVEAQFCNRNIRKQRNIDVLVDTLDEKLQDSGLKDNRYSVIGFGGSGLYESPRSIYVKNRVFTGAAEILQHFDSLYIEKRDLTKHNGTRSADMFGALSFASSLPYRPGVSRTYVLMPCTRCDLINMKLDYSVVHQVLMDDSVTLHILMDADFMLSKKRVAKTLYGVDSTKAYSMKDARQLIGDEDLRKQVKLPKEKLGFCTSLAIESNGTVFAGKKLELERATARRVSSVFGARAAQSARPCALAPPRCECRSTRLHCRPCVARHRSLTDMTSLALWDGEDVDELIDNIMDINLPNIR